MNAREKQELADGVVVMIGAQRLLEARGHDDLAVARICLAIYARSSRNMARMDLVEGCSVLLGDFLIPDEWVQREGGPRMTRARHDAALSQEASRLRALGYSWDQSYDMAEIMLLVRDAGFLAMTSEDYEHLLEDEHAV